VSGDRTRLEVKERGADGIGSRNAQRLRRQGFIPGVLYGKGHSRTIAVEERALRSALTGPSGLHAILDVVVEGQKTPHHAVLKEYEQHAIRGTITHVDFHEVRLDQPIQATVIVQLVGDSVGVRHGGVIQHVTREVRIQALPTSIPEHIDVDISDLDVGETIRLEDLPLLEGVEYLDDPHETVIANCSIPRAFAQLEEEEAEAAEAEAAEGEELEGEAAEGEAAAEAGEQPGEAGESAEE
jgi:large subunit ribosomal protein L25